jgi:membrane protease YdiL (CAAX protease family)
MFRNRTISFIVLTYIITGLYSLLYLKFPIASQGPSFIITLFYMCLPLIASLILQVVVYKEPVGDIGINLKWSNWYFAAALIPIAYALATFGVSLLMPGIKYDPEMKDFLGKLASSVTPEQMEAAKKQMESLKAFILPISIFQSLLYGMTVNALFAFGEEAGWRGFMLTSLKGRNFYLTSLIIGFVWGLWHAPVIIQGHNYPQHPAAGVLLMIIWTILLTPIISYLAIKSGSVIAAAIFHGVLNASAGIAVMFVSGGNDLITGMTGLAGFITLVIFNLLLFIYDKYMAEVKVII